ncbi:hypothetical protein MRB53_037355 [Persea americana]|nr:hypothetical protein MRB53_037355 [Persea americana]
MEEEDDEEPSEKIWKLMALLPRRVKNGKSLGLGCAASYTRLSPGIACKYVGQGSKRHQNELRVYELLEKDPCPYLLCSFLRREDAIFLQLVPGGKTLDRIFRVRRTETEKYVVTAVSHVEDESTVKRWMADVAGGMAWLEKHKLAHQDLRPDNVLLDEDGHVKVIDFDWTRPYGEEQTMGQPPYIRQLNKDERAIDDCIRIGPKTELWAIGSLYYFMKHGFDVWTDEAIPGHERGSRAIAKRMPLADGTAVDAVIHRCWFTAYISIQALYEDTQRLHNGKAPVLPTEEYIIAKRYHCEALVADGLLTPPLVPEKLNIVRSVRSDRSTLNCPMPSRVNSTGPAIESCNGQATDHVDAYHGISPIRGMYAWLRSSIWTRWRLLGTQSVSASRRACCVVAAMIYGTMLQVGRFASRGTLLMRRMYRPPYILHCAIQSQISARLGFFPSTIVILHPLSTENTVIAGRLDAVRPELLNLHLVPLLLCLVAFLYIDKLFDFAGAYPELRISYRPRRAVFESSAGQGCAVVLAASYALNTTGLYASMTNHARGRARLSCFSCGRLTTLPELWHASPPTSDRVCRRTRDLRGVSDGQAFHSTSSRTCSILIVRGLRQ